MGSLKSRGDSPHDETIELSLEKQEELRVMKERIEAALNNQEIRQRVIDDFTYTFKKLGLTEEASLELCESILGKLLQPQSLHLVEQEILTQFQNVLVGEQNLVEILEEKLKGRADLIFTQVSPYLKDIQGTVVDYGAGDGQVTQKLHDELGLDIEGWDVRPYTGTKGVSVPLGVFDGKHVEVPDRHYEAAVITNVFHHEKDNEAILKELDRIVSKRLVIIETVPVGSSEEEIEKDRERTFMNDYLYNRLFHNADIPVPGTFETPEGWIERLSKYGWKVAHSEDLGEDQETIRDTHHLLVMEKLGLK